MGRFCRTEFLGDTKFFQDILFKRWEEAGELTAADSEREWGLSEVPVATVEEGGGAIPRKTKYVP